MYFSPEEETSPREKVSMGGADQYSGQPRGAPPLRVILFSQKTVEILAAAAKVLELFPRI